MRSRFAFATLAVLALSSLATRSEAQNVKGPKEECAAVGLFLIDTDAKKVTVIPQRLEVTYSATGPQEICFAWFVSKGAKSDAIKKFKLKDFEDLLGAGGGKLFKAKKAASKDLDLISIEFTDKPDFDSNDDGYDDLAFVQESYSGELQHGNDTYAIDPDIIIKKGG